MKKTILPIMVAAALMFTACGSETVETEAPVAETSAVIETSVEESETAVESVDETAETAEASETELAGGTDETGALSEETIPYEESALVGTWSYSSYVYTFNEDGTGDYSGSPLTWEDYGTSISILYDGFDSPMVLEYSIDGDTLTIVDSFGEGVEYTR